MAFPTSSWQNFSKVSSAVSSHSEFSGELSFQNFSEFLKLPHDRWIFVAKLFEMKKKK